MTALDPQSRSHRRMASSSSYAPVLIHPSDPAGGPSASLAQSTRHPPGPRIKYPYPLPVLSALDLGYTVYHARNIPTRSSSIALCIARVVVLCVVLGCSTRWRSRGGWIGVVSGWSIGHAVWSVCESQLTRGKGSSGGVQEPVPVWFLGITASISALEYITFLLLLRLSPPGHRVNPLALRLPTSAMQRATEFDFESEHAASDYGTLSPAPPRRTHSRYSSRNTFRPGDPSSSTALFGPGPSSLGSRSDTGSNVGEHENEYEDDADEDEDEYEYEDEDEDGDGAGVNGEGDLDIDFDEDFSDSSSISESSIIDLPPPLSPSRIVAPTTLSVNRGLDILDQTPVIGAVVRRTRSARFLARSPRTEEEREGYGTFGQRGA